MGLAGSPDTVARADPKLALVAPGTSGRSDLAVRMLSMGRAHPALATTGSIAVTLAARTAGTVLDGLVADGRESVRLDTPADVIITRIGSHDGRTSVGVWRTARRIASARLALPGAAPAALAPAPAA